jgi:D-sedoheptulose 7-phosphate isomerase
MENKEFIEKYLEETKEIAKNIDKIEIEKFLIFLFEAWKENKKIFTIGNGGSAGTASHFAADLAKTVFQGSSDKSINSERRGFRAICLNENPSLNTAWINDSGWDSVYEGQLNSWLEEGDIILLISVHGGSGWSGNLVKAIELAKKRKARVLSLAGFDGGIMKKSSDSCIVVPMDSTPHVEGFHSVLQHLIVFRLKQLIEEYYSGGIK